MDCGSLSVACCLTVSLTHVQKKMLAEFHQKRLLIGIWVFFYCIFFVVFLYVSFLTQTWPRLWRL